MSLSPFVFVGIGGSGGKTIRVIRQALDSVLDDIGWEGEWPHAWQFVHVEVAAEPDGVSHDLPLTLPRKDFASLTTRESTYRAIEGAVGRTNRTGLDHHLAWDSWRPFPPDRVGVDITLGAGQYRTIGRVAMLGGLAQIAQRIKTALAETNHPQAGAELREIQDRRGREAVAATNRGTQVFVIASISGGSGSGALLDVCDIVRSVRDSANTNATAVVYTPEIFEGAQGELDPGIAPNSFMALNELLNASWVQDADDAPLSRDVHFERAGVNPDRSGSGPESVFLVGRRNANVTLDNAVGIYRVVGRSLAELTLSEALQDSLTAYARGNRDAVAAGIHHNVPLSVEGTPTASNLYGLGFARLTIGRDFFREYVAERLARLAVERLLDGHLQDRQIGDLRDNDTLLDDLVTRRWPAFLRDSGLDEVGYERNEVINGLYDAGMLDDLLRVDWARKTLADIADGGRPTIEEARGSIASSIEAALAPTGLAESFAATTKETALQWRSQIHDTVGKLVSNELARSGVDATVRLIDRLIEEVKKAAGELRDESRVRQEDALRQLAALRTPQPGEPNRPGLEPGELVDSIIAGEGVDTLHVFLYRDVVDTAARVLKELPERFLAPLRRAVKDAGDLLRREARPGNNVASALDSWPQSTGVPDHLRPSAIEFTLDEVDQFPEVFAEQVFLSVSDAKPGESENAIRQAVTEVIDGSRSTPSVPAPDLFEYIGKWVPGDERLRNRNEQEAPAAAVVHISLEDVLRRARSWSLDDRKRIGTHLKQPLREYLSDREVGAGVLFDRKKRLVDQFEAMLRVSMPLVKVKNDLLIQAHGIAQPDYTLQMSPLNLPADDVDLLRRVQDAAAGVLGQGIVIPVGGVRSQESQVMTTLKHPLHAVVFSSLIEPMLTQWVAHRSRGDFWKWRRSRPIAEWVPIAPDAREALVEGWLVARLLGRARFAAGFGAEGRNVLQVWTTLDNRRMEWRTLPVWGVRGISGAEAAGNVLELVAIATLEVYQQNSLEPLRPFRELIAIATDAQTDGSSSEPAILKWLRTGEGVVEDGDSIIGRHIRGAATPEARQKELLEVLSHMRADYDKVARAWAGDDKPDALQKRPAVEAALLSLAALDRIQRAVGGSTGGGFF